MAESGEHRVERDALGPLAIPAAALYGIHTARAVQHLSVSGRTLGSCVPYVQALGAVKRAAARANGEANVLAANLVGAIETAAGALQAGHYLDALPVDLLGGGGSIGINMNVAEVVANLANESRGGRRGEYTPVSVRDVNASQSTADVCHTAARLAIVSPARALATTLAALVGVVRNKERELAPVRTLARTCLRDAQPVSLSVLFGGYAAVLERRRQSIEEAAAPLHAVALGGTAIGTGEGAPPRYRERVVPILAEITALPLTARANAPDAMQNSDDLATVSAQLRLLAESLLKLAQDLRLLGSGPRGGFGEIELPATQEGSSFFAGKVNPVIPETVMQCAFQVLGYDRAVQAANERAELYLNVFDGVIALNVLDATRLLAQALPALSAHCVAGIHANEERCRQLAASGET